MKFDKDKLRKLVEEELQTMSFDDSSNGIFYVPEVKRTIIPLSYTDSIKLAKELGGMLGMDIKALSTGNSELINNHLIMMYDDLSRYDEYWDIATKILKYKIQTI